MDLTEEIYLSFADLVFAVGLLRADDALLGGALGGVKLRTNRRQGQTEQAQVLLAWSYSAVVYLVIVVLTSLILQRPQPNPCFSKAA